jgi:acetyl esterase/lipase
VELSLSPVFRRLFLLAFWACLSLAVVGAVVLERRQIQQHDTVAQAQSASTPQPAPVTTIVAERGAIAGRSRVAPRAKDAVELFTVKKDIAYGPSDRQKLDLYTPVEARADGKVVIFLYGGFWRGGSKNEFSYIGESLASRGIATIVADYRVYPEVRFPAFVEDGATATRWAADHLGGADKIFLMGHSAGAHIMAMLAANTPYLAKAGVDRLKIRGLIGLAGAYDFLPIGSSAMQQVFGTANDPAVEPLSFAKRPLPPALFIHGARDTTVPPQESEHLASAWARTGADTELKFYSGADHDAILQPLSDELSSPLPTREDILAFIDAH